MNIWALDNDVPWLVTLSGLLIPVAGKMGTPELLNVVEEQFPKEGEPGRQNNRCSDTFILDYHIDVICLLLFCSAIHRPPSYKLCSKESAQHVLVISIL